MRAALGWAVPVLCGLTLPVAVGATDERLAAAEIRQLIVASGPASTLEYLFADREREIAMARAIGLGSDEWLEIAARLKSVSDAAPSEVLSIAIQDALPRNPRGVLRHVASGEIPVHSACGNYGTGQIEDERPLPEIISLVDVRLAAVRGVHAPDLAQAREACLSGLQALRQDLAAMQVQP